MAAKKESKYRDTPQMTGWRLNLQKFASWSLLPLGYVCAASAYMLTRRTRYYLVFHYGELYNENMPFENVLATVRIPALSPALIGPSLGGCTTTSSGGCSASRR